MSDVSKNEGLIQSGGRISANQLAVGQHARAVSSASNNTVDTDPLREINQRLSELVLALEAHSSSVANHDELINSTEIIRQELSKGKPNKLTITAVLDGIANSVKSVTAIASIVEALRSVVLRFF